MGWMEGEGVRESVGVWEEGKAKERGRVEKGGS